MSKHVRSYTDAPTQDEIAKGYAPSEVRRTPFVKFLFWTFAGLAVTYAITYGVVLGLDEVEKHQQARYARMATRAPSDFQGIPLQPSPGHDRLDWEDTEIMFHQNREELAAKGWENAPSKQWKMELSEKVIERTAAALKAAPKPATRPASAAR